MAVVCQHLLFYILSNYKNCLILLEKVDRLVDVLWGSIGLLTVRELVDKLINHQDWYNDVDLCQLVQDSEKVSYQS